jgi:deoxyribonuclease-1
MYQKINRNKQTFNRWLLLILLLLITFAITACQLLEEEEEIKEIKVAAFNVRIFGKTKMSKDEIPEIIAEIIARYDVILIQEIRDSSQTAIYELLDLVNQTADETYELVLSNRLGRTSSKEQYAYFYRTDTLTLLSNYHYDDGEEPDSDSFQREPFIVRFRAETGSLDFTLIGIHTSPDDAEEEIDSLVDVYDDMLGRWNEADAMIIGDFNADCTYVSETDQNSIRLWTDDRFTWWVDDNIDTTTTSTDCAYDRIVTSAGLTGYVVDNSAGVLHFDQIYELSDSQTQDVSDHYPVEITLLPE